MSKVISLSILVISLIFVLLVTSNLSANPLQPIDLTATYTAVSNSTELNWGVQADFNIQLDFAIIPSIAPEAPTDILKDRDCTEHGKWDALGDAQGDWSGTNKTFSIGGTNVSLSVLKEYDNTDSATYFVKRDVYRGYCEPSGTNGDDLASSATDYTFSTWVYVDAGADDDALGVIFRYQDNQHYYLFEWWRADGGSWGHRNQTARMGKIDGCKYDGPDDFQHTQNTSCYTSLDFCNTDPTCRWQFATWHYIELVVSGSSFTVKVYDDNDDDPRNGTTNYPASPRFTLTGVDDTFATGTFGPWVQSQTNISFYNIQADVSSINIAGGVVDGPRTETITTTLTTLLSGATVSALVNDELTTWIDNQCQSVPSCVTAITNDITSKVYSIQFSNSNDPFAYDIDVTPTNTDDNATIEGYIPPSTQLHYNIYRGPVSASNLIGTASGLVDTYTDNMTCSEVALETYYYSVTQAYLGDESTKYAPEPSIVTRDYDPISGIARLEPAGTEYSFCGDLPMSGTYSIDICSGAVVEYQFNNGTWTSVSDSGSGGDDAFSHTGYALSSLGLGTHSVVFRVTDSSSDTLMTASHTFSVVSVTSPYISIIQPADSADYSHCGTLDVTGTYATDPCLTIGTIEYSVDNGSWTGVSSITGSISGDWNDVGGINTSALSLGAHTVVAKVTDSSAVTTTSSVTTFNVVDPDVPVVAITLPDTESTHSVCEVVPLYGTFTTDACFAASTVEYSWDGGAWTGVSAVDSSSSGSWSFTPGLDMGSLGVVSGEQHTVQVQMFDSNSSSSVSSSITIHIVDSIPSIVEILEPQSAIYSLCASTTISGTFQTDPCKTVASIEYKLNAGSWVTVSDPGSGSSGSWNDAAGIELTPTAVGEGQHIIVAKLYDNVSGTAISNVITFTVSSVMIQPSIAITSLNGTSYPPCNYDIPIAGTYIANACPTVDVTVQYMIDGTGTWENVDTVWGYEWSHDNLVYNNPSLTPGATHYLDVRILDSNGGTSTALEYFYVSDEGPTLDIVNEIIVTGTNYAFDVSPYIGGPSGTSVVVSATSLGGYDVVEGISGLTIMLNYPESVETDTLQVTVTDCQDKTATDTISIINQGFTGNGIVLRIYDGQIPSRSVSPIDTNVVFMYFEALNGTQSNEITQVTWIADDEDLAFSKTFSGDADNLSTFSLYLDGSMTNGTYDVGDSLLGTGTFPQDSNELTIVLDTPLSLGADTKAQFILVANNLNNTFAISSNNVSTGIILSLSLVVSLILLLFNRKRLNKMLKPLVVLIFVGLSLTLISCFGGIDPESLKGSATTYDTVNYRLSIEIDKATVRSSDTQVILANIPDAKLKGVEVIVVNQ